jgi:DNA topoisomerase II
VLFNHEGKIKRYDDELHVIKEFFPLRGTLYQQRKEFMLAKLQKDYEILFNKVKFIQAIISETLKINKVKRNVILQRLQELGLKPMSELNKIMEPFAHLGPGNSAIKAVTEEIAEND